MDKETSVPVFSINKTLVFWLRSYEKVEIRSKLEFLADKTFKTWRKIDQQEIVIY